MNPIDPANVDPAELLMYLYRIQGTSSAMASRADTQGSPFIPRAERVAWSTVQTLANLMHAEFHAILHGVYDPRRQLVLLTTVLNMYDPQMLSAAVGALVPPMVTIDHPDQRRAMAWAHLPYNAQGTWVPQGHHFHSAPFAAPFPGAQIPSHAIPAPLASSIQQPTFQQEGSPGSQPERLSTDRSRQSKRRRGEK